MLYCMPLIIWTALSLTALSGNFVPLMFDTMATAYPDWTGNEKLSLALFALIPMGVGEILGGLIMAKVSDKLGYLKTIKILLPITLIAFGALFLTLV
jgi:hypothetical protein